MLVTKRKLPFVFTVFLMLVSASIITGCGDKSLKVIPADGTILAFGDSLTFGVGTSKDKSYPSVLAELSGRRVVNAGISGEETSAGLMRFNDELTQTQPDLVILLEGGNDILRNRDLKSTKRNLAAMIEMMKESDIPVVLIGVPDKRLFSDSSKLYGELAEEYQLVFADDLVADLMRKAAYKSDSIHFNQAGYRVMAEQIYQLLLDTGAL